jgi:hypothetical protein
MVPLTAVETVLKVSAKRAAWLPGLNELDDNSHQAVLIEA